MPRGGRGRGEGERKEYCNSTCKRIKLSYKN